MAFHGRALEWMHCCVAREQRRASWVTASESRSSARQGLETVGSHVRGLSAAAELGFYVSSAMDAVKPKCDITQAMKESSLQMSSELTVNRKGRKQSNH